MSIFQCKDYWSTSVGKNEEFDCNGVCVGNIDNDKNKSTKIAISSFEGNLRIFEPTFGEFKLEHCLLDKNMGEPIYQISLGNIVINSNDKQMIILYKKRLQVIQFYDLKSTATSKVCFDHKLPRSGFNFCLGKIGDKGHDIIFVQSVDGVISIIEQDSVVNNIELYEMILPGCISYVDKKDYLILSTPSYEIECYSYSNLATVKSGKNNSENKIIHNWVVNVGEIVKEMKVITNVLTKRQEIYVLTDTVVFMVNTNGQIVFQKKMDYEPLTCFIYNIEDTNYVLNKSINIMQMIASDNGHVMIYKGSTLSWAFK